jgi:putative membrane protein
MTSPRPALLLYTLAALNLALLAVSRVGAFDGATWWMEIAPVLVVWPLLLATHKQFPLTPLLLWLVFVHACILMLGGHYSYARVPLGAWIQQLFDMGRNPYDGIGHLAQGFIPAIAARELLLRKTGLVRGGWLFTVVTACCLAISAIYELIEWVAAISMGQGADEFLGAQGDPWDTQKDMAMAWLGAMLAQVLLARWHDRQLRQLQVLPRAA